MTEQNLRHWSALSRTDPKHTKPFQRAGGFRGTATRPIWVEMRLTEHFGPCGIGWGCDAPEFALVPAGEEILVFCTLACWYMDDGKRATVYGIGGDKVLVKQQSGLRTDDEAYKKAFTDALGNAFKHVGSNADIHMGLFEDSKYKAEVAAEFAEEAAGRPADARSASPPQRAAEPHSPQQAHTGERFDRAARDKVLGEALSASGVASTSGQLLAPSPEEPPAVTQARTASRSAFWARDDYGIDPAVIQGGIGRWDAEMLALAESAPNLDAYTKLKEDNRAFFMSWSGQVAKPVIDSLNRRLGAAYRKLLDAEGIAA